MTKMNKMLIYSIRSTKNIKVAYIYFAIHMITEIICFYFLESISISKHVTWIMPLLYDCLAFVPQGIIGSVHDKHIKDNYCLNGIYWLLFGFTIYIIDTSKIYLSMILVCIGNCLIHIAGAEMTLRVSKGKMSHSSIFVAGGSFGVVIGKVLANYIKFKPVILLLGIIMIPLSFMAEKYKNDDYDECENFNYHNRKYSKSLIIFLMVFVVAVRGYIGYGIPTSWNKTIFQSVLLYFSMGVGKAMGGILIDFIGIKKTIVLSTLVSLPFLCFGDNVMVLSLIGVMLFSMTMAITLAVLVSCIPKLPGVAFGWTTIGLFAGVVPIFFVSLNDIFIQIPLLIIIGLVAYIVLNECSKEYNDDSNC